MGFLTLKGERPREPRGQRTKKWNTKGGSLRRRKFGAWAYGLDINNLWRNDEDVMRRTEQI